MTAPTFDLKRAHREAAFLIQNPHFDERPASISEFLGPGYLDIKDKIRPGIKKALYDIFGDQVSGTRIAPFIQRAMLTGAVGIGKTTFASIALPYMCHWVLCLKDPQDYFNLLPGSRIAFMQMSTSEEQAREVVFGDIFARIKNSDWFVNNYPYDTKFTTSVRFEKDVWILPGDSADTTFEGYNILGGIIDEADSHKITQTKDYAADGYDAIEGRITSRFQDQGLLIVIGQMKKANGFAHNKYVDMLNDPDAYVVRMTIWDSLGWDKFLKKDDSGERDSFFYNAKTKEIMPDAVGKLMHTNSDHIFEVPNIYKRSFVNAPEKALRDLAGIPPATEDPFISLVYKVELCSQKWVERYDGYNSPVDENPTKPLVAEWFMAGGDPRKRAVHIDLAYSSKGDAVGFAMGHVDSLVGESKHELKPYIVIDLLMRIKAAPGTEILISDIRRYLYELTDHNLFKISTVTMDGFQSTDTIQQLRKKRYKPQYLSIDKSKLPYEDLRDAIYEERIEFPKYLTHLRRGDTQLVEIVVKELLELSDNGKMIDHDPKGSKDVADALAGVCHTLMGDRKYKRGLLSSSLNELNSDSSFDPTNATPVPSSLTSFGISNLDRVVGSGGMRAPVPPGTSSIGGLSVPARLRPRGS